MSFSLKGKTALVTGSSRGIGRAIAERLAAEEATVVINYARNRQLAQEVVDGILARSGKAFAIQADVSKPAEVRRLFDEAVKAVGPLEVVVANAGVHILKPLILLVRWPKLAGKSVGVAFRKLLPQTVVSLSICEVMQ